MSQPSFTLEEVLKWASEISGKGSTANREQLVTLVRETLEELHNEESVESLRKWCICSCGCSVTIPNEMECPIKYKILDKVGPIRDITYTFRGHIRKEECTTYREDLHSLGTFPTYFDIPNHGARVAARSLTCFKSGEKEPYILVQGKDLSGKEVFSVQDGKTDVGVRVPISQANEAPEYSDVVFSEITDTRAVNSELTVQIIWCNTKVDRGAISEFGLLSILSPGEERGCFRRYSLGSCIDGSCCYNVEVLGRLSIPPLKYDNELIVGFDSSVIRSMLRSKHHQASNEISGAQFNAGVAMSSLRKKNTKLTKDTDSLQVFVPTAAGNFPKVY